MAGRIRDEDIALVRERTNIAEIVGETVTLRNAGGGSLKGLCPFHDEKSPSFHVTPARGYYHCFGCGVGGDAITYVMSLDHLSFAEAVERLAERAGVHCATKKVVSDPAGSRVCELAWLRPTASPPSSTPNNSRPTRARRDATFWPSAVSTGPRRSGSGSGFAPRSWDALVLHLRGRGFTDEELRTAGLARDGRQGLIDRFVGRLLWPIRDITGDPVGFGARRLFEDDGVAG